MGMKRILLIRSDGIRHRALGKALKQYGFRTSELIYTNPTKEKTYSKLMEQHFKSRNQFELDYFKYILTLADSSFEEKLISNSINSEASLKFASDFLPDYVITFGCPILKDPWLKLFPNSILGIHLGLSPYYRGSGTNFFPFVNNELAAVGFSLMKLDLGVDTGPILHQRYAKIVMGDSIHTIGTRLMQQMFDDILRIIDMGINLSDAVTQPSNEEVKYYVKRDFTDQSLIIALQNLQNDSVNNFLDNEDSLRKKFPLIRNIFA